MEHTHSFGGLGLMSRLIDFETDPGGGGGDAPVGGDPGGGFPAPAIPAADDSILGADGTFGEDPFEGGDEPEPTADETAAWAGPSQEEWQSITQFTQQLQQLLEQDETPAPEAAPEPVDFSQVDTSDPEQLQSMIAQEAERLFNERMGPYQPILDQQAQQAGEQMVTQALDEIAGELGEFDRNQALLLTNSLLANGVPPQQAFRQAAAIRIADEKAIRESAVADYVKQMGAVADVDPQPAGGTARIDETPKYDGRDPDKYEKAARDFMARRNGSTLTT